MEKLVKIKETIKVLKNAVVSVYELIADSDKMTQVIAIIAASIAVLVLMGLGGIVSKLLSFIF